MKYAYYDETTGRLLGWYDESIHGAYVPKVEAVMDEAGNIVTEAIPSYYDISDIPTPNIPMSDAEWQTAVNNGYNYVDAATNTLAHKDFSTLTELKEQKINMVNTNCKKEIVSGFTSSALGTEHVYQSEEVDQLNLIGAVMANVDDYFKCGVKDANGDVTWTYELHTVAQLQQVLQDGKSIKLALLQKAGTLKEQVRAATTKADVDAIVW